VLMEHTKKGGRVEMRRLVVSTVVVGAALLWLAGAVLTTLRAEARGPLAIHNGDLLDVSRLQGLRVVSAMGGEVRVLLPNGVLVRRRGARTQQIVYLPHARFRQRLDAAAAHDLPADQDAVEPRAHLAVLGLPGGRIFYASTVRILPHHRAIGGRIDQTPGRDVLEIVNRRGAYLVRLQHGVAPTLNGRPLRGPLRAGMHVATLAVPDPREQDFYLADTVRVLPTPVSAHIGGLITSIAAATNTITLYNKAKDIHYTLEMTPKTKMTLNKWTSGYSDLSIGDHLTVSGVLDPAHAYAGSTAVIARIIRVGSPSFGGYIAAIAPAPHGTVVLTVRAHRGHTLRITAPGAAAVVYGAQPARVLDLLVGEKIGTRGTRTDKFALTASFIHVYPRQRTVGGAVAGLLPGSYRVVSGSDNTQYIIHTTSRTVYTLNGRPTAASGIVAGTHIRVRGYDALHNTEKHIPVIIATHVTVVPRHHTTTRRTTKRVSHPVATPAPTAHAANLSPVSGERRPRVA